MTSPPSAQPQSDKGAGLTAADYQPPQDLASCITALIEASRQAGRESREWTACGTEIPVNAARQRLYARLARHGLDGTGWMPEPPTREEFAAVERERDDAVLEVERLNGVVYDLQERLCHERERAERAEANAQVAGWSA